MTQDLAAAHGGAPARGGAAAPALGRLAAAAGAAWVGCALVGNGLTEAGAPTEDTPQAALRYFELLATGSHRAGLALELLGFCLLLAFLGRLHGALRDAEGSRAWLPTTALGAGLALVAVKVGSGSGYVVGLSVDDLTGEQAQLLLRLGDAAFLLTAMLGGVLVLATAGSALVSGLLPRWLAVAGVPIGLLAVLGSLLPSSLDGGPGVAGFLLGLLWVAATSLVLAARREAPAGAGREVAGTAA
jgi:hypothetical protein